MIFNYLVGPAGSGKTSLANALYEHISHKYNEIKVIIVNLDPGALTLPYNPHVDVRDFVTLEEVMAKHGLGPNGGMIAATDTIIDYIEDLKFEISEYNNPEVVLIDTPGQMELFAFRATGPLVASSLGFGDVQKLVSFLFDPAISRQPNGFISTMFLSSSVQFRFRNIPQLNILSKIDMIEPIILPRLAKGAIVSSPIFALVGDAPSPEVVAPLDDLRDILRDVVGTTTIGSIQIIVSSDPGGLSPMEAGRQTADSFIETMRRRGLQLSVR